MLLQLPVEAHLRSPVAIYNRATAYPSQHNNHWNHQLFQTTTQHDAWLIHGYDALLRYHSGHPGEPAYARELAQLPELVKLAGELGLGEDSTGGWARSAWGSVMRQPSAL